MNNITIWGQTLSTAEILGFLTGVIGVWLTIRQNILCFPVGIVNVLLYAYLFSMTSIRLYADAILQVIYLVLLIYGWVKWNKSKNALVQLQKINRYYSKRVIAISIPAFILLGWFLAKFTNASLPWIDAALTIISLAAQWMVAKKLIENWILWIFVNIAYIPLYLYKDLKLTALLYFVFLILAIKGLLDWKKQMTHQSIQ